MRPKRLINREQCSRYEIAQIIRLLFDKIYETANIMAEKRIIIPFVLFIFLFSELYS